MATVNQNAVKYGVGSGEGYDKVVHPCNDASFPIKQGELVYLDTSAHIIKPVASDANAATLAGVALQPSHVSSNLDNSSAISAQKSVVVGSKVVAFFKTTAAETYHHGDLVYVGADAQTITTVAGSNAIGRVVFSPALNAAGVTSITGASGVTVDVLVKSAL